MRLTSKLILAVGLAIGYARRGPARKEALALRKLAQTAIALMAPLADRASVAVELAPDSSGTPEPIVEADPSQLQQGLTNLLVNALHVTLPGGLVTLRVGVADSSAAEGDASARTRRAFVAVQEAGEGIAPEHLPRIFEPFFTTKAPGDSTGLGLSLARGIVQEHGGALEVDSKAGRGSVFTVRLPLADVDGRAA